MRDRPACNGGNINYVPRKLVTPAKGKSMWKERMSSERARDMETGVAQK